MTLFTPEAAPVTVSDVVAALRAYRLPIGDELQFQNAVAAVFAQREIACQREYVIHGHGTIDFYVPSSRIGVELKVKGSPSDVVRQLQRYASSDEVDVLILVTGRVRLGQLPAELHGKPLTVVAVWEGLL